MASVEVNKPAPDFKLMDFEGNNFQLSAFRGLKHVLIVLNRGFM
jgi:peroxiredoxin